MTTKHYYIPESEVSEQIRRRGRLLDCLELNLWQ